MYAWHHFAMPALQSVSGSQNLDTRNCSVKKKKTSRMPCTGSPRVQHLSLFAGRPILNKPYARRHHKPITHPVFISDTLHNTALRLQKHTMIAATTVTARTVGAAREIAHQRTQTRRTTCRPLVHFPLFLVSPVDPTELRAYTGKISNVECHLLSRLYYYSSARHSSRPSRGGKHGGSRMHVAKSSRRFSFALYKDGLFQRRRSRLLLRLRLWHISRRHSPKGRNDELKTNGFVGKSYNVSYKACVVVLLRGQDYRFAALRGEDELPPRAACLSDCNPRQ